MRAFQPLRARLPAYGVLARRVAERATTGQARVAALERSKRRTAAPLLYDLAELQRHANRLYGYTAQQTLDAAQELYEAKVLSYPRTDSRHLSSAIAASLSEIVDAIGPRYPGLVVSGSGARSLGKRFVDDSKVTDHHALIPTAVRLPGGILQGSVAGRIYDLVCRRLLSAWHPDLVEAVTRVLTEVKGAEETDIYATSGTSIEAAGWKVLDVGLPSRAPSGAVRPTIPAGLAVGESLRLAEVVVHRKQTQPPKPFTDGTLLAAMETAGKQLDERALTEALRDAGLGTPATRAAIVETLIARKYVERSGKSLRATPSGISLIAAVHPLVKSAEMTGRWEQRLSRMERGEERLEPFMRDIAEYVTKVVEVESGKPMRPRATVFAGAKRPASGRTRGRPRRSGSRRRADGTKR
jgi:DNA topoisomerase-3